MLKAMLLKAMPAADANVGPPALSPRSGWHTLKRELAERQRIETESRLEVQRRASSTMGNAMKIKHAAEVAKLRAEHAAALDASNTRAQAELLAFQEDWVARASAGGVDELVAKVRRELLHTRHAKLVDLKAAELESARETLAERADALSGLQTALDAATSKYYGAVLDKREAAQKLHAATAQLAECAEREAGLREALQRERAARTEAHARAELAVAELAAERLELGERLSKIGTALLMTRLPIGFTNALCALDPEAVRRESAGSGAHKGLRLFAAATPAADEPDGGGALSASASQASLSRQPSWSLLAHASPACGLARSSQLSDGGSSVAGGARVGGHPLSLVPARIRPSHTANGVSLLSRAAKLSLRAAADATPAAAGLSPLGRSLPQSRADSPAASPLRSPDCDDAAEPPVADAPRSARRLPSMGAAAAPEAAAAVGSPRQHAHARALLEAVDPPLRASASPPPLDRQAMSADADTAADEAQAASAAPAPPSPTASAAPAPPSPTASAAPAPPSPTAAEPQRDDDATSTPATAASDGAAAADGDGARLSTQAVSFAPSAVSMAASMAASTAAGDPDLAAADSAAAAVASASPTHASSPPTPDQTATIAIDKHVLRRSASAASALPAGSRAPAPRAALCEYGRSQSAESMRAEGEQPSFTHVLSVADLRTPRSAAAAAAAATPASRGHAPTAGVRSAAAKGRTATGRAGLAMLRGNHALEVCAAVELQPPCPTRHAFAAPSPSPAAADGDCRAPLGQRAADSNVHVLNSVGWALRGMPTACAAPAHEAVRSRRASAEEPSPRGGFAEALVRTQLEMARGAVRPFGDHALETLGAAAPSAGGGLPPGARSGAVVTRLPLAFAAPLHAGTAGGLGGMAAARRRLSIPGVAVYRYG